MGLVATGWDHPLPSAPPALPMPPSATRPLPCSPLHHNLPAAHSNPAQGHHAAIPYWGLPPGHKWRYHPPPTAAAARQGLCVPCAGTKHSTACIGHQGWTLVVCARQRHLTGIGGGRDPTTGPVPCPMTGLCRCLRVLRPPGKNKNNPEACGNHWQSSQKPRKTGGVLASEVFWGSMGCLGGCILGWFTGV